MNAGRQAALGGFVLGGAALGLAAVLLFGQFHFFSPVTTAAVVFRDSIAGLAVGAPVTFRGVRIGSVVNLAIQFDPKTQVAYIPVTLQLDRGEVRVGDGQRVYKVDLPAMIARGLRAELNTQSFVTGQSEIDFDFDPQSPAVLHPDITDLTEIPTKLSAIQRVKEQLSQLPLRELTDNASATLQSLRTLSEKLDTGLPPLVESLKTTSDSTNHLVLDAAQVLRDWQGRVDSTLAAIERLSLLGDRQLDARGADLHRTLAEAAETAARARGLLENMRALTADRGATRLNLDAALRDIAAAAASLRGFAADVEHDPQLLLIGRRP